MTIFDDARRLPPRLRHLADTLAYKRGDDAVIADLRDAATVCAKLVEMEKALRGAKGYLVNAKIDLATGVKKSVASNTIEGGIKLIDAALAPGTAQAGAEADEQEKV